MAALQVTFLGTGTSQGVPVITCKCPVCRSLDYRDKRLRASVLLEINGLTIVVDTGPDFRAQMLGNYVDRLDAVLFTHEHRDHLAGLDDIRGFNFGGQGAIDLYGLPRVTAHIHREFHYAFSPDPYPGVPQLHLHEIGLEPFTIKGVEIEPIEVFHYKLPVLGFKIGAFAYVTDAKTIAPAELNKLRNLDVLVLNALQHTEHISHFTLQEALDLVADLKPKKTYLTHISHRLGRHADVEAGLPPGTFLAYDGLKISV